MSSRCDVLVGIHRDMWRLILYPLDTLDDTKNTTKRFLWLGSYKQKAVGSVFHQAGWMYPKFFLSPGRRCAAKLHRRSHFCSPQMRAVKRTPVFSLEKYAPQVIFSAVSFLPKRLKFGFKGSVARVFMYVTQLVQIGAILSKSES